MKSFKIPKHALLLTAFLTCFTTGCAEGPLWQTGTYAPWVRNQWAEEERIADTIFSRKNKMNQLVSAAGNASIEQMESAAKSLSETIRRDPILLMRLHAVKLLGELNCPASIDALVDASKDHNSDVRIAAIQSWSKLPGEVAIGHLQEFIGSDTDVDVRLAATRALGNFHGKQAVEALALALQDNDPALQLRATESLGRVTGESIGRDVNAWKQYVQASSPEKSSDKTGNSSPSKTIDSMDQGEDDSFFR